MRARINAFIVCIDKQSFFYQTVQPAKSSVRFDFHLFSLLQQLCAGELVAIISKSASRSALALCLTSVEGRKDKICVA